MCREPVQGTQLGLLPSRDRGSCTQALARTVAIRRKPNPANTVICVFIVHCYSVVRSNDKLLRARMLPELSRM